MYRLSKHMYMYLILIIILRLTAAIMFTKSMLCASVF